MNVGMNFMSSPSMHNQSRSPMNVHQALLSPIPERCNNLINLMGELSLKELQAVFPLILEHIFGFGNHSGWGLKSLYRSYQPHDFDSVRNFLSPEGALFHAIYRLLGDTYTKFEFSVSCLPISTQNMFDEGTVSPLYSNKVPYHGPSRCVSNVLLNAYEYFFFHFAYLTVNPSQQKPGISPANERELLYTCLLEDYLSYFLPVDGRSVPENPVMINSPSANMSTCSSSYGSSTSPLLSPNSGYVNMIYPSSISPGHTPANPLHSSPNASHNLQKKMPSLLKITPTVGLSPIPSIPLASSDHMHLEIWRTKLLVMVLTEFWLSLGGTESRKPSFSIGSSNSVVPNHDHMKMVRIFVKHLHYFSNSSKSAVKPAWNLPPQQTPLDEFKISVLPHFVQKKLYHFLRLSFERWPLDATFRLPLETWLSYIQPWRYVTLFKNRQTPAKEKDENEKEFDPTWQKFITENLLFYTVIFQYLIPRFFRMDLTSITNSYMLFRVSKVFAQQHLNNMIEEAEQMLQGSAPSWMSVSGSRLGAATASSTHVSTAAGTLRQHVSELEGPGFVYTPLFSISVQNKLSDLLRKIMDARTTVQDIEQKQERKRGGWFHEFFASIFLGDMYNPSEDYLPADCKRAVLYLQFSASQLCYLFKINEESCIAENSQMSVANGTGPDYTMDSHGNHLTNLGRYRLQNNLRKANVQYHGNPDLQPIRSYEVAFLVRLFYHLSSYFNEKYNVEMGCLYMRQDWLGRLSRQILAPPVTCSRQIKNGTMKLARVEEEVLPPRISLRVLAHKQVLGYFLALYLVAYIFNYSPLMYVLFLVSSFVLYVVVKAGLSKTSVTPS